MNLFIFYFLNSHLKNLKCQIYILNVRRVTKTTQGLFLFLILIHLRTGTCKAGIYLKITFISDKSNTEKWIQFIAIQVDSITLTPGLGSAGVGRPSSTGAVAIPAEELEWAPCVQLTPLLLPLVLGDIWPTLCTCSFAFSQISYKWNHTISTLHCAWYFRDSSSLLFASVSSPV